MVTDTQVVLLLIQVAESDIVANRERDPLHRYASRSGSSPIETRRRLNSILIVNLLSLKRIEIVMLMLIICHAILISGRRIIQMPFSGNTDTHIRTNSQIQLNIITQFKSPSSHHRQLQIITSHVVG